MRKVLVLVGLLTAACAAVNQQKQMPVKSDQLLYKNLKVLPPDISHDELIATMRGWSRALGVHCDHCHVQIPAEPKPEMDFPSDAKPEKQVARTMVKMVRRINDDYVSKVNEHGTVVGCYMCHHGHVTPEASAPAPGTAPGANPPTTTPAPPREGPHGD
jgi:hypothetical protein